MRFIVLMLLFTGGFLLGKWYAAAILTPIFYGLPKALREYCRGRLTSIKPVLGCLSQPIIITLAVFAAFLILAFVWHDAILYLNASATFNFGNAVGGIFAILNLLFSAKAHADMRQDYEALVQPYRKV